MQTLRAGTLVVATEKRCVSLWNPVLSHLYLRHSINPSRDTWFPFRIEARYNRESRWRKFVKTNVPSYAYDRRHTVIRLSLSLSLSLPPVFPLSWLGSFSFVYLLESQAFFVA